MHAQTVFFIGKPGCGKGTQAKLLSQKTGWAVFSSGQLFRQIAAEETPVGRKVKKENDAGMLQPHWFAMYLYLKSLFSIPDERGAIFDGFNRKMPEANLVVDSLKWLDRSFSIIHLNISDAAVKTRLGVRKDIEGRADDSAVDERLKEYREYTEPVIEFFKDAGVLIEINGEESPEEISAHIFQALGV
jgi:adenylate kinase